MRRPPCPSPQPGKEQKQNYGSRASPLWLFLRGAATGRRSADGHADDSLDDPAVLRPAIAAADAEIHVPGAEALVDHQVELVVAIMPRTEAPRGSEVVVGLDADRKVLGDLVAKLGVEVVGDRP